MQSIAATSAPSKVGLQPSPPSPSVIPGRPCLRSPCRAFSSTASLSTWQSTKQFNLLHAPEKRGIHASSPPSLHFDWCLGTPTCGTCCTCASAVLISSGLHRHQLPADHKNGQQIHQWHFCPPCEANKSSNRAKAVQPAAWKRHFTAFTRYQQFCLKAPSTI